MASKSNDRFFSVVTVSYHDSSMTEFFPITSTQVLQIHLQLQKSETHRRSPSVCVCSKSCSWSFVRFTANVHQMFEYHLNRCLKWIIAGEIHDYCPLNIIEMYFFIIFRWNFRSISLRYRISCSCDIPPLAFRIPLHPTRFFISIRFPYPEASLFWFCFCL